jgi:serine/threonine-protein kinase
VSRVFAALAAAHGARHPETGEFSPVIHRDVSPGNVLVSRHGEVKLTDFGIARVAGVTDETPSGTLLGTYGYMAPELINGDSITVRADVYGAALLLWELLAGRHAFQRESLPELEILQAMAKPSIPPIEEIRPDLPASIGEALGLALRADADQRIGARDMLEVLRGHVRSTEARSGLADGLAQARRRPRNTIPDAPPSHTAMFPVEPQPGDMGLSSIGDLADTDTGAGSLPRFDPAPTPTVPLAEVTPDVPVERRYNSDTPTAVVTTGDPDEEHEEPLPPLPIPRRAARWLALLGSIGLALVAALAVVAGGARASGQEADAPAERASRAFESTPLGERTPPRGRSEWVEPIPEDTGLLDTPPALWNHRVFVDGFARGVGGDLIRVPCGRHAVRLGSYGHTLSVDVPCGGTVTVDR